MPDGLEWTNPLSMSGSRGVPRNHTAGSAPASKAASGPAHQRTAGALCPLGPCRILSVAAATANRSVISIGTSQRWRCTSWTGSPLSPWVAAMWALENQW
jgi:hypothetical protein